MLSPSHDLVNWKIAGHSVPVLTVDIRPGAVRVLRFELSTP
ncbi:hypothetical protein [Streptomyces canus]